MSSYQNPVNGLLLSGGVDSAVLLGLMLARGEEVVPIYVRTDCLWAERELQSVRRFIRAVATTKLKDLVVLEMPLSELYGNHWSITGIDVPDDASSDEAVRMPGRNPLLLLKPALWCAAHRIPSLAIATLAANPFDDATPEFFSRFEEMLRVATGASVSIARPFERLSKSQVLKSGRKLPLELTFSCLAPQGDLHCGTCNKCRERRQAFATANIADATDYASVGSAYSAYRKSLASKP